MLSQRIALKRLNHQILICRHHYIGGIHPERLMLYRQNYDIYSNNLIQIISKRCNITPGTFLKGNIKPLTGQTRVPNSVEETRQDQPENIKTLSEAQSKKILKSYGIPVVHEVVAMSEDHAVLEARKIGFPVVLKGLGANLTHKTEAGLVKINLRDEDGIRQAYREIKKSAGENWEGCLLQPLIHRQT